jgi:hypothetical protein
MRERDAPATAGETPALQHYPASLKEGPKLSTFVSRTPVEPDVEPDVDGDAFAGL